MVARAQSVEDAARAALDALGGSESDADSAGAAPMQPQYWSVRPVLGGIKSGAGLTAGVAVRPYESARLRTEVAAAVSHRLYYGVDASVGLLPEGKWLAYFYGQYQHLPEEDFYGIYRYEDSPTPRVDFRLNEWMTGLLVGVEPVKRLMAGVQVSYRENYLGRGADGSVPDVQDIYTPAQAPGLGINTRYLITGIALEYEHRGLSYRHDYGRRLSAPRQRMPSLSMTAENGLFALVHVNRFSEMNDASFSFYVLDGDVQEFWTPGGGANTFALRQHVMLTHVPAGNDLPFYMMPVLGGSRSLRGYSSFKFRDRNTLLLNSEYRRNLHSNLQGILFVDGGYIFENLAQIQLGEPKIGYGVGVRLRFRERVLARLEVARSSQRTAVYVRVGSYR